MKQTDTGHYDVGAGEKVTITIQAHQVAEDLAVSLDGNALQPTGQNPAVYSFNAASGLPAQFIDIACHFSSSDPDSAFYQFSIRGSQGGGDFNASSIRKQDSDWEAVLQFTLP